MFSVTVADRVATLTLARPPVNAISGEWVARFDAELDALAERQDWTVLHLRSELKVFSAGADLAEIGSLIGADDGAERMYAYVAGIQRLFARIEHLPKVTLAEIGGAAMGGGLELALACDLRIAAADAKLGLPEARLGLVPGGGGTQRLTRLCGRAVAGRIILGAEVITGADAAGLNIVHWSVPRDGLAARARTRAEQIASMPVEALAAAKACIAAAGEPGRGGYTDELEATRRLLSSPATRERVEGFLAGNRT